MKKSLVAGLFAAATLLPASAMAQSAFNGTWQADANKTVSYKVAGDSVTMSTPSGQTYTAKVDGSVAPYSGDPDITNVTLLMTGDNTLVETDKHGDDTVSVQTLKVTPDGKTISVSVRDKVHGTMTKYVATRQPT